MLILEHHFYIDKQENVWSERVVDNEYLQRYLQTFEEVWVCARMQKVSYVDDRWKKASGANIHFIGLPNFTGARQAVKNYFHMNYIAKEGLGEVDGCIMRSPSLVSILLYNSVKKSKKPLAIEFVMAADKMILSENIGARAANYFLKRKAQKMCKEAVGVSYVTRYSLQKDYPYTGFTESYSSINLEKKDFYCQKWNTLCKPLEYVIAHTGYMDDDRKGQHILIKAVAELIKRGYALRLVLIGDGIERENLENLVQALNIEKIVTFTGALYEKKEILSILKTAHLFVMPTKSEGLPRSILEAMSVGLPCISSDVDGIPELLDEEYLISTFKVSDYVKKISNLLDDWDRMITIGKRNYDKALEYEKTELDKRRKKFYDTFRKNIEEEK